MAVGWSHGHEVIKRDVRPAKAKDRKARGRRSSWVITLLEISIAVAAGLAITWFLATVTVFG
jgi:hypothetical protein